MNDFEKLGLGLGGLPLLGNARTRSISPENPTGEKGKGGMAIPDSETLPFSDAASDLGQGWKVNPYIRIQAGQEFQLADQAVCRFLGGIYQQLMGAWLV